MQTMLSLDNKTTLQWKENAKINVQTRGPRWPCITHLIPRQVSTQLDFWFKRRSSIQIFKMVAMVVILDFQSE